MPVSHKAAKPSWEFLCKSNGFLFLNPLCVDDSSLASEAWHWNMHVHKKSMMARPNFENLGNNNF